MSGHGWNPHLTISIEPVHKKKPAHTHRQGTDSRSRRRFNARTYYDIEFEDPTSIAAGAAASRLFARRRAAPITGNARGEDFPARLSRLPLLLGIAGAGFDSNLRPALRRGTASNRSSSSSSSNHHPLDLPFSLSPEREKRRTINSRNSSTENSIGGCYLDRVPEDSCLMDFRHRLSTSSSTSEQQRRRPTCGEDDRASDVYDVEISRRFGATEFTPHYLGGQPFAPDEDADEEDAAEEEEWVLDEQLARQGLYRGSYRRLVALYTITPIFTLLIFVALAVLPSIAYPLPTSSDNPHPWPYSSQLPFPFPELLTGAAFWSLSYLLTSFLSSLSAFLTPSSPPSSHTPFLNTLLPALTILVSTFVQSTLSVLLRLTTLPLLLIPHYTAYDSPTWRDPAFRRVWWVALGWTGAEALVGIKQGYDGISLYRHVLVRVKKVLSSHTPPAAAAAQDHGLPARVTGEGYGSMIDGSMRFTDGETWKRSPRPLSALVHHSRSRSASQEEEQEQGEEGVRSHVNVVDAAHDLERQPLLQRPSSLTSLTSGTHLHHLKDASEIEEEVERDLDQLIALRGREELEDLYGMPFIRIPVFISCLHRLNSVLFVLGSTLLLSAAYMRSTFALLYHPLSDLLFSFFPVSASHLSSTSLSSSAASTSLSKSNLAFWITLPIVIALQWFLVVLHTPHILPRIGVQTFVYVGFMLGLGALFTGLGVWKGVV